MFLKQKILFDKNECEKIISLIKIHNKKFLLNDRSYDSYDIVLNKETQWIFDRLSTFFQNETNIKIKKLKPLIHFHKFIVGDKFNLHNDERDFRVFAVGVLLNDNFEGGDFIFHQKDIVTLNKITGNTYIFDVKIKHQVNEILLGERYSLLWFLQNNHIRFKTNKLL